MTARTAGTRRLLTVALLCCAVLVPAAVGTASRAAAATPAAGSFVSLTPTRVLDTRHGTGASGPVAAHSRVRLVVAGVAGVPQGASAVVLNVTVTGARSAGDVRVYPDAATPPLASNLNFVRGQTVPNLVVAPVAGNGMVDLYNDSAGSVQLIADVSGYFVGGTPSAAGSFVSLTPTRVLDTRHGTGASGPVAAHSRVRLVVAGVAGVPQGASAVVLNVTVTGARSAGDVRVYPDAATPPLASNLNFVRGQTVPNLVVAPVAGNGMVDLYNDSAGSVQLIADVSGHFLGAPPDTTPPGPVSGLTATADSSSSVTLHWTDPSAPDLAGVRVCRRAGAAAPAGPSCTPVATVAPGGRTYTDQGLAAATAYGYDLFAVDTAGNASSRASATVTTQPAAAAQPAAAPGEDVYSRSRSLYTGDGATQFGVAAGTIQPARATVLTGHVANAAGGDYTGARVEVSGHPEFGHTLTDGTGHFRMVVNGGSPLLVRISDDPGGVVAVQRWSAAASGGFSSVDPVVLLPLSPTKADVTLGSGSAALAPLGTTTGQDCTNAAGDAVDCSRANALFLPAGTSATAVADGGGTAPVTGTVGIRATEYTVGASGPDAMPGQLPAQTAYTYAVDLTVDQAQTAATVQFTDGAGHPQTLYDYVTNFLHFPVGTAVPAGYYDPAQGRWVGSRNGRVVKILSIDNGLATMDSDGDGAADDAATLAAAGFTDAERSSLAGRYPAGSELWRVPITHFTAWDFNFGYGCKSTCAPPTLQPFRDPRFPEPCLAAGSVIGCENQSLGERVPVPDTPYTLAYDSSLSDGFTFARHIHVPVESVIPAFADGYRISVDVAGRTYSVTSAAPPTPTAALDADWDGKDGLGQRVYGPVAGRITAVAYYQLVYKGSTDSLAEWAARAGSDPTLNLDLDRSGARAGLSATTTVTLDGGTDPTDTIGGWDLDVDSRYDPVSRTEITGDGTTRHVRSVGTRITGLGNDTDLTDCTYDEVTYSRHCGDGGPLAKAVLSPETGTLAAAPDGSLYFFDTTENKLRRISDPLDPDPARRTVTAVAGAGALCLDDSGVPGNQCLQPDGGPAAQQAINYATGISIGADGTVYLIADLGAQNPYLVAVRPDGTLHVLAGDGQDCSSADAAPVCGDGGPATSAQIDPELIAAAPDGVYFWDRSLGRIREVTPDGTIRTAFGCTLNKMPNCGTSIVDGASADNVDFINVGGLAAAPDGTIWLGATYASYRQLLHLDAGGRMHLVGAGVRCTGDVLTGCRDGAPVSQAAFENPYGVQVDQSGAVHLIDYLGTTGATVVRTFSPGGVVRTELGGDVEPANTSPEGGGALTTGLAVNQMAVLPDGRIVFLDDQAGGALLTVDTRSVPSANDQDYRIPAADGATYRVYDRFGIVQRVVDALTGAVLTRFTHDAAGRLTAVTDEHGRTTVVRRDSAGAATALVAPSGATTALSADSAGHLATITVPTGEQASATYTPTGLLLSWTDLNGGHHSFTYGSSGRLLTDTDATGATQTLSCSGPDSTPCTGSLADVTVTRTSATGAVTTYRTQVAADGSTVRTVTEASGARTVQTTSADGTHVTATRPDGTTEDSTYAPDARFGLAAPFLTSRTITRPSGAKDSVTRTQQLTFLNLSDPFSASQILVSSTRAGATTTSAWDWDGSTGTITVTHPGGRVDTSAVDAAGRLTSERHGADTTTTAYTYDGSGDLTAMTVGTAVTRWTYDGAGHLLTATTAAGVRDAYGYDADGRIATVTDGTGRTWHVSYDGAGNSTTVVTPLGGTYRASSDAEGRTTGLRLPGESAAVVKGYDGEGNLTSLDLPDGTSLTRTVGSADLVTGTSGPAVTTTLTQRGGTDLYSSADWQRAGGPTEGLAFTYDGRVPTGQTFTGPAAGALVAGVDGAGRTTDIAVTVGGATDHVARATDPDGLLTGEGPFTLRRGGPGGATDRVTSADGAAVIAQTVGADGRVSGRTLTVNGAVRFSESLTLDADGRPTAQTVDGSTTGYTYDEAGRMSGAGAVTYSYDADGNLLDPPAGPATYDSGDRITAAGGTAYGVDGAGRTVSRGADRFTYDAHGLLLTAVVGGHTATYVYDALERRVAETVDGATTQYLYGDPARQSRVSAVVEPDGSRDLLFYDDRGILLGFRRDGSTMYYVGADHLGSPRVVTDASGAVVQRIGYDAWGGVTSRSDASFAVPLGFAGGLPDPLTGFVHLGLRDYDPAVGRFTSIDPLLFAGGRNLYAYVGDQPQAAVDPTGLAGFAASEYEGVGGGIAINVGGGGVSICGEVGFGLGGGYEVNSDGYTQTSVTGGAELTAKVGSFSFTDSASFTAGPCVPYYEQVGAKATYGIGNVGWGASNQITPDNPRGDWRSSGPSGSVATTVGNKVEGKVFVRGCLGVAF